MKIMKDKFHVETSLSENQLVDLLKKNIVNQTLYFGSRSNKEFAGQLRIDKKEFTFAFFYQKAKCAMISGYYIADGERATTIYFDIRWPFFEVFLFILGIVGAVIVPAIYTMQVAALPMQLLIAWPLIALTVLVGTISYYYIPSTKRARKRLLNLFPSNVRSVIED